MEARIIGEIGSRVAERAAKMAVGVVEGLLVRHCFMWLAELGGRVIVA